jgi:hypothetical protein
MANGTSRFQYKARSSTAWEKRADQQAGAFIGFVKEQYKQLEINDDNYGRILPPTWDDPQHYGLDVWVHFGIGPLNATVLCPLKMRTKPCPVCHDRQLKEESGREDVGDLKPKRRVLVWWLDRKNEALGAQYVALPWTLDRDIAVVCQDPGTGEMYYIDDPYNGYNVFFKREGKGLNTKYIGIQLDRKPSEVPEAVLDYITQNPLPEILLWRDYEELKDLYSGAEAAAPPTDRPQTQYPSQPAQPPQQTQSQQVQEQPATPQPPPQPPPRTRIQPVQVQQQPQQPVQARPAPVPVQRPVPAPAPPPPPQMEMSGFCPKTLVFEGNRLGCGYEPHDDSVECNFTRNLGPVARAGNGPSRPAPVAVSAQAGNGGASPAESRAGGLRARFGSK